MIFVKFKKQDVVCANEISWFAKKVICTTYGDLGILDVILGANFVENNNFSISETAYFSALFHLEKMEKI